MQSASTQGMLRRGPIQSLIFFAVFYLYLWLDVDLRLVYHGGPVIVGFPAFFRDWAFFCQYLSHPGGVLGYVSAFLSQLFCFSWAGALVVTLQAWLISLCAAAFLRAMNAFSLRGVRFVGPVLMLIGYAEYRYHFNVTMMVLGALILAWLYVRIRPESCKAVAVVFLVLHAVAYVMAAGGHLLFVALCGIYELLFRRRWRIALSCLASAAVIPWVVGYLLLGVAPADAIGYSLFAPLEPHVCGQFAGTVAKLSLLYLFLPLSAILLWLRREEAGDASAGSAAAARSWVGYAAPFLIGAVVAGLFRGADAKAELEAGYYAYHRMWPEVLEVADRLREGGRYPNPCVIHLIDRALYHTNRLGRDLFGYPQNPGILLLSDASYPDTYVSWYRCDTLLDLGQVNYAEFHLNHCAEIGGPRPDILKRLAYIHMVKGDIPTARVYLNAVAKTLFDAGWALRYLAMLKSDPALSADRGIQRLRGLVIDKDRAYRPARYEDRVGFHSMERMLVELLEKNSANRMAYEYLMTLYMLNKRLDKFGQHLGRLKEFGCSRMPRLYEEAVLARAMVNQAPLESSPYEVGEEMRARAERFMGALDGFRRDQDPRYFDKYMDSYLYYYFCFDMPP